MDAFFNELTPVATYIANNFIQIIFAIALIKYRREFGIIVFLYLIMQTYWDAPTAVDVIFYGLTSIFAAGSKDTTTNTLNRTISYNITDNMDAVRKTFADDKTTKSTFDRFTNISDKLKF